jgi:hypothetical protein
VVATILLHKTCFGAFGTASKEVREEETTQGEDERHNSFLNLIEGAITLTLEQSEKPICTPADELLDSLGIRRRLLPFFLLRECALANRNALVYDPHWLRHSCTPLLLYFAVLKLRTYTLPGLFSCAKSDIRQFSTWTRAT